MTSNQLQNYANQEEVRHNTSVENETNRHNLEMEKLQKDANAIQQDYNQAKIAYDYWNAEIDKNIRETANQINFALGERKNQLQEQLQLLYKQKYDNENAWNVRSNEIKAQAVANENARNQESARHNQAAETIETTRAANELFIAEKNLEYKNTELRENIGLKRDQLENDIMRTSLTAYEIETQKEQRQQQLDIENSRAGAQNLLDYTRTQWTPFQIFWGGVGDVLKGASRMWR